MRRVQVAALARRSASSRMRCVPLAYVLCFSAMLGCGDDSDDRGSDSVATSSVMPTTTQGNETGMTAGAETSAGVETSTGAEPSSGTTSVVADCGDATDETTCGMAQNAAEGGGCTWMAIHELVIDNGMCVFSATERGECVGTEGLDDGCNIGSLCDGGNVEAYFREVSEGSWEMARGQACRGLTGFTQCDDKIDEPCSCACEIP